VDGLFPKTALSLLQLCLILYLFSNVDLLYFNINAPLFEGFALQFLANSALKEIADCLQVGNFKVIIAHHFCDEIGQFAVPSHLHYLPLR
jgi:hypothetical protein